jgi:hypothetical protein
MAGSAGIMSGIRLSKSKMWCQEFFEAIYAIVLMILFLTTVKDQFDMPNELWLKILQNSNSHTSLSNIGTRLKRCTVALIA